MAMSDLGRPNLTLASYLAEAGWSPRTLAREINRLFGQGSVSETAPYYWRDAGGVPHVPVPALAAYALSRQLGRPVSVAELWQGRAADSASVTLASSGLDLPWTFASTRRIAEDWAMAGLVDRRIFLAVSGAALARAVWAYLARDTSTGPFAVAADRRDDPLVVQIEQSVPLLQRLDDAQGGAANLSYVGAQVRAVALVLHENGHSEGMTRRLLVALADLGQLAGFSSAERVFA
jgi:hypothetical protein